MTRYTIIIINLTLILATFAFGETQVSGEVSGTWDSDGSPYIVTDNITVPRDEELEILPGVEVLFDAYKTMTVRGTLTAVGTENDSILFSRNRRTPWRRILLSEAGDESILSYCIIELSTANGEYDNYYSRGGGLYCDDCDVTISHCTFRENEANGDGGAVYFLDCEPLIIHTRFLQNTAEWNGGAVRFRNSNGEFSFNQVVENEAGRRGGGMHLGRSSSPLVIGNEFKGNQAGDGSGGVIYIDNECQPEFIRNLVIHNRGGIIIDEESRVERFLHNTIVENECTNIFEVIRGSYLNAVNSIIYDNGDHFHFRVTEQTMRASYCDIQDVHRFDIDLGEGVIDAAPRLEDDYYPTVDSPCIDSGDPDSDPDPDGSRADMGCHWFDRFEMTVEPEAIDFGIVSVDSDTSMSLGIIIHTNWEEPPDEQSIEIRVIDDDGWLEINPAVIRHEPDDTLEVPVRVVLPENGELGQVYSAELVITSAQHERIRYEIPVSAFLVEGYGRFYGAITDAETDEPFSGVQIDIEGVLRKIITDESGRFDIHPMPAWTYNLTIEEEGFFPVHDRIEIVADGELEYNAALEYAVCLVNPNSISVELQPDSIFRSLVTISNSGSGTLVYSIERCYPNLIPSDWDLLLQFDASEGCEDACLQGVEFDGEYFYLSGSANDRGVGMIHVFSRDGRYIRSFDQFRRSRWGMRDLAWDGELLYGGDGSIVYGFTTDGRLVTQFQTPLNLVRGITWDDENNAFWICGPDAELIGIQSDGDLVGRFEISEDVNIFGLGTYPEEIDGYTIFAFCRNGEFNTRILKFNPGTGECIEGIEIETSEELLAGGLCVSSEIQPQSWSMACLMMGSGDDPDEVQVIRIPNQEAYQPWMTRQDFEIDDIFGIAFIDSNFYASVKSEDEDVGHIYVFSRDGDLVGEFEQFQESRRGIRDLTWDGELLWGCDDSEIFGFTTDGDLEVRIDGPHNRNRSITYDRNRELFWVGSLAGNLYGIDREGNVQDSIYRQLSLIIHGLATFPEDLDGCTVYAFCRNGDYNTQINKVNPETDEWHVVADIETDDDLRAAGIDIVETYDPMVWTAVGALDSDEGSNRIGVWQVAPHTGWLHVGVDEGVIEPQGEESFTLVLDAAGFPHETNLDAELWIKHNGRGNQIIIPLVMSVDRDSDAPLASGTIPDGFSLDAPCPNPFNNMTRISFSLSSSVRVRLDLFDINGRRVVELLDDWYPAGSYCRSFRADGLPSGIYLLKMKAGQYKAVRKVALIR